jgi:hypothetical protein
MTLLKLTSKEQHDLAQKVISGCIKLADLEDDIRQLWLQFENLAPNFTIMGCATKKEFCEKHLHRTPRAIQYMLDGGNAANMAQRRENISLPAPETTAAPADEPITDAVNFPANQQASKTWSPDKEKRKNRSAQVVSIDEYKVLVKRWIEEGYAADRKSNVGDPSHLWAAKDWAKLRLDLGDIS